MPFYNNCVNCGSALKITEWGPNRICPICGQNTVNVDIKEVHVFFGDSHSQSFQYFIKDEALDTVLKRNRSGKDIHIGVDYHYMRLYYELCFGNISNPPYSNANYYAHHSGSYRVALARRESAFEKLGSVDNTVPIYLWLSDNEANEYMNLLYFAKSFERFENVFLVRWNHTEEDFEHAKFTMIDALERKVKLSVNELDELSAKFTEIQSLNAECLMGNSYGVEPWLFSKVEKYVLDCMDSKYKHFGEIYSNVFDLIEKETSFYISYHMVEEAVHRLMMIGKIESHGACEWWGESGYNNVLCTQSFCIETRQPTQCSYNDVLNIVCDAFEFGYTYPLYDLLDDDSMLVKDEQTVIGKWGIIEYIENDGAHRVHSCKQKVECNIAKVASGKGYQKDDIYIYLGYKGDSWEHWIVKVLFDGTTIRNIEFSKPRAGLDLVSLW